MQGSLSDIRKRLSNPGPFFKAMFNDLGDQCLEMLRQNMYGSLNKEWTFDITAGKQKASMTLYHTRLEGDREKWEPIFTYHNDGTRVHWIEPVNAEALSWEEYGVRYFSKGHYVSAIVPLYFAEKVSRIISDLEHTLEYKWQRWINEGIYTRT